MLGESVSMLVPQVVGFRLTGSLREGATATDLVLTVTQILRQTGVVGKFVEYFGAGVSNLPLADRATIGNMSPEYGATCGFFPVDQVTLEYLRLTGRPKGTESRSSRPTARRISSGTTPTTSRPTRRSWSSISATSSPVSPARAPAGPRAADRGEAVVPGRARDLRRRLREPARRSSRRVVPRERPGGRQHAGATTRSSSRAGRRA